MYGLDGKQVALIMIIIGAILFGVGYKAGQAAEKGASAVVNLEKGKSKEDSKETVEKSKSPQIAVYVCGAVKNPGIYHLNDGARVADAVYQAVPLASADLVNINLAEVVTDGQQIQLYTREAVGTAAGTGNEPAASGGSAAPAGAKPGKININKATLQDLDGIPGIGPSTAQKIIDYRQEKGKFKSVDELTNVSGIGEKKLDAIKQLLTV